MTGLKPAAAALLCASVLVLCSTLSVDQGQVVVGSRAGSVPLPCVCIFKTISGQDCPFCGLTRSLVSIGHLAFRSSWRYHRAGVLVYLAIVIQLVASLVRVRRDRRPGAGGPRRPTATRAYQTLGAVLLVAWIIRLAGS